MSNDPKVVELTTADVVETIFLLHTVVGATGLCAFHVS